MSDDTEEYNASKIVVLEGPLGIRKRPAMYIGTTGIGGVLHLLFEALDNAVDEALAGYCNSIVVRLSDGERADVAEISDNGRGIPVDIMPKYNKSALEVIMTTIHKGAKFDNNTYKVSGGLHGVGLTVINALSEYAEVIVKREGKMFRQTYSRGVPTSGIEIIKDTQEKGTTVRFMPDADIFPNPNFEIEQVKERMGYTAFLNKGLRLTLIDERSGAHDITEYVSKEGVADFIRVLNEGKNPITGTIYMKKQADSIVIEIAMQYNNTYEERIESFVNNIKTTEGGTHEIGFRSALTRAVINYLQKNGNNKKDIKVIGDDVREGLTAVLHVLMQSPEFEGQTKEKLGNTAIKGVVEEITYSFLSHYFEEHPSDARQIAEKVMNAAVARESARKARELARKKNAFEGTVLPGKLADCIEENPEKTEIFIVEGESAGGSSKQGRDKHIQAILPLRGKILNVEKATDEKIFESKEIRTIVTAFGTGIQEQFNPEALRYGKIIIMSDADVDGSHIRTLILTFLYRYMKPLIERGKIYIALPPLYKVSKGKASYYCYNDEELRKKSDELGEKVSVQRYKGLGEMNPEQLWETTMDPARRVLKNMKIKDAERADRLFTVLMGVDVSERKKFLEEHSTEVKFLDT